MAANPNPAPRRDKKIVLVQRATDPTKCCVCGRALDDTTELSPREHFRHVRAQERSGFKRGKAIVHYTEAQREARREAISAPINAALAAKWAAQSKDTPTPAKPLETPLVAPCDVPSAEDKRTTDKAALKRVFEAAPRDLQWLVTLAEIDYDAGDFSACGSSLWLAFRLEARDAVQDARAQAEREDWLDASDARRWMA